MFDWSPSSGVTTRWGWAEWGREERPPELLLHPNGLMCLWIWGRRQVWTRGWQGEKSKSADTGKSKDRRQRKKQEMTQWDADMKKRKWIEHIDTKRRRKLSAVGLFNSAGFRSRSERWTPACATRSFLCNWQNLNNLCKTFMLISCQVTPEVLKAFTSDFLSVLRPLPLGVKQILIEKADETGP